MVIVAFLFSCITQCPLSVTTPSWTLLAAAIVFPKDFSQPRASAGIASLPLARKSLLSRASWSKAANGMNPECMAPRHGVQTRVMIPSVFAEPAGRGRELVPETVEINAFAPGDETLHVRAADFLQ